MAARKNKNVEDTFVPALGQAYEFRDGKMVFPDGVSYSLSEAVAMASDLSLTERDIQVIHAVKMLWEGDIVQVTINGRDVDLRVPKGGISLIPEEDADTNEVRAGETLPDPDPDFLEGLSQRLNH